MDTFGRSPSKLDLSKVVFILFNALIIAGTLALFAATALLTEGLSG